MVGRCFTDLYMGIGRPPGARFLWMEFMQETQANTSENYIGIDLGTTNSVVAHLDRHGNAVTIPNANDELVTQSVVLLDATGQVVVGREAKRSLIVEPGRVADRVKRDMGDRFYRRRLDGKHISPARISALILKKLKQDAEARIGPVAGAVITVPAYFDETRRQATAAAGEMAGLNVVDILNEPTAAAIAYAYRHFVSEGKKIEDFAAAGADGRRAKHVVVYDLGGGTFDVTVMRILGYELTVLAVDGDFGLGGCDWDLRIANYLADRFKDAHGDDPLTDPQAYQTLLLLADEMKRDLSRLPRTRVVVTHGGKEVKVELTREQFEAMTADLLLQAEARLVSLMDEVRSKHGLTWADVDDVIAVGGSTRMPQILRSIEKVTGKGPNCSLPPSEAIAHGAAIHAATCVVHSRPFWRKEHPASEPEGSELSAAPPSETPAAAPPPDAEDEELVVEIDDDGIEDDLPEAAGVDVLDPDPKQASPFDEDVVERLSKIHKQDVNAHSLGVRARTHRGKKRNSIVIPRNTPLPATRTKQYGTKMSGQTRVHVRILQGESRHVGACIEVGDCRIENLPSGLPKGSPVDVTFAYDSSGLLQVRAVEPTSGREASTTIRRTTGLDEGSVHQEALKIKRITVL